MNQNIPETELHTYFDEEADERIFYACTDLLFDDGDLCIKVPANFLSDGLSVPKMFQGFISASPRYILAGVLHDWLYKITKLKMMRKEADKIFLKWLKIYGVGLVKRQAIYWGVRIGGRGSWQKLPPSYYTGEHK